MFLSKGQGNIFIKVLGLFSIVRGYNILILILAQYLTARYVFSPNSNFEQIIFDLNLFYLVFATALSTSSGYIINNYFDAEKDKINRPQKFLIEHTISQGIQFRIYLFMNLTCLVISWLFSLKAVIFFLAYILGILLYSVLIKRLFWLSNIYKAFLTILPFFAITLYFKNFERIIFLYAGFLFLLILIKDIIKDFENFKGDWVHSYKTLPIVFGNPITKLIISTLILVTWVLIYLLTENDLGLIEYYFIFCVPYMFFILFLTWISSTKKIYLWIHNLLKLIIVVGVFGIYFMYK
ncbi:MAG: ubiquinone biosynthesis protein UbiA [Flavobacteriaceae bacterium]|nr:ubiquinone biosynthesis protein UbiA [Flavobacteriaceae bacterium]|tara:strand:- start:2342 stop:3223 length:882 start_codon:yes stop_codon:yes gene_type:complete